MKNDRDDALRRPEHLRDLPVAVPLEVAEHEDLRRPRGEPREGPPQALAQLPARANALGIVPGVARQPRLHLLEGSDAGRAARAHEIERAVDGGEMEVAAGARLDRRLAAAAGET